MCTDNLCKNCNIDSNDVSTPMLGAWGLPENGDASNCQLTHNEKGEPRMFDMASLTSATTFKVEGKCNRYLPIDACRIGTPDCIFLRHYQDTDKCVASKELWNVAIRSDDAPHYNSFLTAYNYSPFYKANAPFDNGKQYIGGVFNVPMIRAF